VPVAFRHVQARRVPNASRDAATQTESRSCRSASRRTRSDKFNFSPPLAGAPPLRRSRRRPFLRQRCRRCAVAGCSNDFSLARAEWAAAGDDCPAAGRPTGRSNREVAKSRRSKRALKRTRGPRRLGGPINRYDGRVGLAPRPCNHSLKLCDVACPLIGYPTS